VVGVSLAFSTCYDASITGYICKKPCWGDFIQHGGIFHYNFRFLHENLKFFNFFDILARKRCFMHHYIGFATPSVPEYGLAVYNITF